MDEKGNDIDEAPSAKALDGGYNQTYVIMCKETNAESKVTSDGQEVFFRCGNWCYKGDIQLGHLPLSLTALPTIIPALQRQQGSLRYYCNSNNVPKSSKFCAPLEFLAEASEFVASEIISDSVENELRKMSSVFPWIDDDSASTYFELTLGNVPSCFDNVGLVATKIYTRGLIIISVFFEKCMYFVISAGEGDQPLLDVRFPDVSKHGQGVLISTYNDHTLCWRKLTLWHILAAGEVHPTTLEIPKIKTLNASSANYEQTYCVMKNSWDGQSAVLSVHHDVLFRFGSWCYAGRVQLTPALALSDIPFVIPALRMQQSRLDYLCDVSKVPTTSPFAPALEYVLKLAPLLEQQIVDSEETLRSLIDRLTKMGLGESVSKWLEGDSANSFFEFKISPDSEYNEIFKNMELVASKSYRASGIITITIIFQQTVYVSVLDGSNESPLLDSRFPDVSGKGRGYQVQSYNDGIPGWTTLRKVSIWQTVNALEQEFRDRAMLLLQQRKEQEDSRGVTAQDKLTDDDNTDNNNHGPDSEGENTHSHSHAPQDVKMIADVTSNMSSASIDSTADDKTVSVTSAGQGHRSPGNKLQRPDDDSKNSSSADLKSVGTPSASSPASTSGVSSVTARPHHIPKMADNSLSKKLEEMRRTMGTEGNVAPWDMKGRPMGSPLGPIGEGARK